MYNVLHLELLLSNIYIQTSYQRLFRVWKSFVRYFNFFLEIKQSIKQVSLVWLLSMFSNTIIGLPPLNELFIALSYSFLFINSQFQSIWILSVVDNEHNVVHLFDFPSSNNKFICYLCRDTSSFMEGRCVQEEIVARLYKY
jgi:hypothetical protein